MPAAAKRRRTRVPAVRLRRFRPSPLPDAPATMLASLAAEPFDHPDWISEPKYDGLRVLVRFDGEELTLISRNGKAQNFQLYLDQAYAPAVGQAVNDAVQQLFAGKASAEQVSKKIADAAKAG